MKKLLFLTFALLMSASFAIAKPASKQEIKTVVFTTDITCHNCMNKIMNNVPVLGKGIKDVNVNLEKKEVTVKFDTKKNNEEHIIDGFSALKINAHVKADEKKKEEK